MRFICIKLHEVGLITNVHICATGAHTQLLRTEGKHLKRRREFVTLMHTLNRRGGALKCTLTRWQNKSGCEHQLSTRVAITVTRKCFARCTATSNGLLIKIPLLLHVALTCNLHGWLLLSWESESRGSPPPRGARAFIYLPYFSLAAAADIA